MTDPKSLCHGLCCCHPSTCPWCGSTEPCWSPALIRVPVLNSPLVSTWHGDPRSFSSPLLAKPSIRAARPSWNNSFPPSLPRTRDYLWLTRTFTPMSSLEHSPPALGTQWGRRCQPHFADGETEAKCLAQQFPQSLASLVRGSSQFLQEDGPKTPNSEVGEFRTRARWVEGWALVN